MSGYGRRRRLAGVRTGEDLVSTLETSLRETDRAANYIRPKTVTHTQFLPPARDNEGLLMYVKGITRRMYYSDGSTWRQI
jgi:hypothetical protein